MLPALLALLTVNVALCGGSRPIPPLAPDGEVQPITFEDFTSVSFFPHSFMGTWIDDHQFWYPNRWRRDVFLHDMKTNTSTEVLPNHLTHLFMFDHVHSFSSDMQIAVVWDDRIPIYGNSNKCNYTLANVVTGQQTQLGPGPLQLVVWSGKNDIIYVYENNIYFLKNVSTTERRLEGAPITSSGDSLHYNGVATWVYEEEVLGTDRTLWPSPNGEWLAYLQSDESMVPEVSFMHYGEPGSMDFQYPKVVTRRYPKVGQKNPVVRLFLADLNANPSKRLAPLALRAPKEVTEDFILLGCVWVQDNGLLISWTNRLQSVLAIALCDTTGSCYEDNLVVSYTMGWVTPPPLSVTHGGRLATILPHNNFRHLVVLWWSEGTPKTAFLTSGEQTVIDVLTWDGQDDYIYFKSAYLTDPSVVHIYRVHVPPANAPYPYPAWDTRQECISCGMRSPEGVPCMHAEASFSKNASRVAIDCRGPGLPFVELYDLKAAEAARQQAVAAPRTPYPQGPKPVRHSMFDDNIELRLKMRNKLLPESSDYWLRWQEAGGRAKARVRLWLPPGMDKSGATKYPMVVNVYGGPDFNQVTNKFRVNIGNYLVTSRNIIYAFIDVRGSGNMGMDMLHGVYRRLGEVEVFDTLNATRSLQMLLPYIDCNRTGIWGWSYGGYLTAHALEKDIHDVFRCGVSVAPVTSLIYYDSVYIERFMGLPTPEDNWQGYKKSDLTVDVDNLKNKKFLLMHGTEDDNVHFQHSMALVRTLEMKNILFQEHTYPDESHSIDGLHTHVYHTMDNFWTECFELQPSS